MRKTNAGFAIRLLTKHTDHLPRQASDTDDMENSTKENTRGGGWFNQTQALPPRAAAQHRAERVLPDPARHDGRSGDR